MPFFGALIVVACPATSIAVVLAWVGWRQRHRGYFCAAGLGVAVAILALGVGAHMTSLQMHYFDGWDLNPNPSPADLAGTWHDPADAGALTLLPDGRVRFSDGGAGAWTEDRATRIISVGRNHWYPLQRGHDLVLLPTNPECLPGSLRACADPDTWDKESVWSR